jgi:hypothetical protein
MSQRCKIRHSYIQDGVDPKKICISIAYHVATAEDSRESRPGYYRSHFQVAYGH